MSYFLTDAARVCYACLNYISLVTIDPLVAVTDPMVAIFDPFVIVTNLTSSLLLINTKYLDV